MIFLEFKTRICYVISLSLCLFLFLSFATHLFSPSLTPSLPHSPSVQTPRSTILKSEEGSFPHPSPSHLTARETWTRDLVFKNPPTYKNNSPDIWFLKIASSWFLIFKKFLQA